VRQRSRVRRRAIVVCLLSSLILSNALGAEPVDEALRINRLAGLCRLWGFVKYFHPALAYRTDIDWDAALVETVF
jgi:hypothetical protein